MPSGGRGERLGELDLWPVSRARAGGMGSAGRGLIAEQSWADERRLFPSLTHCRPWHTLGAMRLRLPELLREHRYTAYRLARESGGRISLSTIYRLKRSGGRLQSYSAQLCEAIVAVLGLTDANELFDFGAGARTKRTRRR